VAKILLIEINEDSEGEMIKGFCSQEYVNLKCKVLEMHKNLKSYKEHIKEDVKEQRYMEDF